MESYIRIWSRGGLVERNISNFLFLGQSTAYWKNVLRVEKGSRGANRTGTHFSARPRRKSGFRYAFWSINKASANLLSIKMCRRVRSRYIRGQKLPQASVGLKIRLKEDEPARLHVSRCAQTAVWTSSPMITYFTFSEHGVPGNTGLLAEPDGNGPDEVKKSSMEKNPIKKWCGSHASPGDISKIIIIERGTHVNGGVHRDMCLRGKFLPFIGDKYPDSGYLSWTDQTVAHYARDTVHFLDLGRDRPGHLETGWYPSKNPPALPNKGLLGRSEAGCISRRVSCVLWGTN